MRRSEECVTGAAGDCLLQSRRPHNCRICNRVRTWIQHPDDVLIVQEIRTDAVSVYAGKEPTPPLPDAIMRYRTHDESEDELRSVINSLVNLAREVWLCDERVATRIYDDSMNR